MNGLGGLQGGGRRDHGRLRRAVKLVVVLVLALTLQLTVVSDLPAWGAVGDLMLVLAVATASVSGDAGRAALAGFVIGLTYDLMLGTPFGLSALVYTLVGYGVGTVGGWFAEPPAWFYLLVALVAGVLAVATTVGIAMTLGLFYPWADVVTIAVVVATWNGLLILPLRRLMAAVVRSDESDSFWVALP